MDNMGLVFDLDGTLVDTLPDICAHINRVRTDDYGLKPRSAEELRAYVGHGVQYLAENAIPEVGKNEVPRIVERYRHYYLETPHVSGKPYPSVVETLKTLDRRSDVRLAIVTNKPSAVAEKTVAHYLPRVSFDFIAGPDRVSARKPDPAHLLEALARINCQPAESWYVGDHPVDRECAERAHVRFLGATYGFGGVVVEPEQQLRAFSELLTRLHTHPVR